MKFSEDSKKYTDFALSIKSLVAANAKDEDEQMRIYRKKHIRAQLNARKCARLKILLTKQNFVQT
jgi:hypothetical protein